MKLVPIMASTPMYTSQVAKQKPLIELPLDDMSRGAGLYEGSVQGF